MSENKVKFGLKNVYYAIATIASDNSATYATPVAFPGAVSMSLDPEGENTVFHADNIDYWVANDNSGYSGDLEMARMTDSFRTDILGEIVDSNGVMIEDQDASVVHFALLFQFEGDVKARRHVFYNCTATRPSVSGSTLEGSKEPATESTTIKAASVYNSDLGKNMVKSSTNETTSSEVYDDWFETVYTPVVES